MRRKTDKTTVLSDSHQKTTSKIRCTDKYVYFYSDKTPFSNWNITPGIKYDGYEFGSSETLFMYLKAKVFRDDEMAERIVPLDPGQPRDVVVWYVHIVMLYGSANERMQCILP